MSKCRSFGPIMRYVQCCELSAPVVAPKVPEEVSPLDRSRDSITVHPAEAVVNARPARERLQFFAVRLQKVGLDISEPVVRFERVGVLPQSASDECVSSTRAIARRILNYRNSQMRPQSEILKHKADVAIRLLS
jgi:hypothetical protein